MSVLQNLKVRVSIDKLTATSQCSIKDIFIGEYLDEYKFVKAMELKKTKKNNQDKWEECANYGIKLIYKHFYTGNLLRICKQRRRHPHLIPAFMMTFDSSYFQPVGYGDVLPVVQYFENEHNITLRPSKIDVAVDLVHPEKIELHEKVCRSIRAGKKTKPTRVIGTTHYFGSSRSARQTVVYDKKTEMRERKRIKLKEGDASRVEAKLNIHKLNNFVTSIKEIGSYDWSCLYGKDFSFHVPNIRLKGVLGKRDLNNPIWVLRDIMHDKHGVHPSNFFRDYLREHKRFSKNIRQALSNYRWNKKG